MAPEKSRREEGSESGGLAQVQDAAARIVGSLDPAVDRRAPRRGRHRQAGLGAQFVLAPERAFQPHGPGYPAIPGKPRAAVDGHHAAGREARGLRPPRV